MGTERARPCGWPHVGVCALRSARPRRVVAFNSDSPHLPASVLEDAFEALAGHDVVVGPTHDGGYYLVGAKGFSSRAFRRRQHGNEERARGSAGARSQTLQLSVGFTDPFYDIDVAVDLTRLAAELELAPARAPRTAVWLKLWAPAVAQLRTGTVRL